MSDKRYPNVVRAISERPWAILEGKLEAIAELIRLRATGAELSREEIEARVADGAGSGTPSRVRGIAIIPISGVISPRANLFTEFSGGTSIEALRNQFADALADDDVSAILFDVNSPGGAVDLVPELGAEMMAARGQKPMVAVANTLAASAGYWLASAADEVYSTPSGDVGSIGVYAMHEDWSKALEAEGVDVTLISAGKFKTEGNSYEPLSDEALSHIQELVDSSYDLFTEHVAEARGATNAEVRNGFGQGRLLHAKAAAAEGLIDGVQTFDDTVRALLASGGETGAAAVGISGRSGTAATVGRSYIVGEKGPESFEPMAKKFVDEAEDARRAVASLVTRLGSLAEVGRGRLTVAKREVLEELRDELIELEETLEETLAATAPSEDAEETTTTEDELELEHVASLASAGARLRLNRGG